MEALWDTLYHWIIYTMRITFIFYLKIHRYILFSLFTDLENMSNSQPNHHIDRNTRGTGRINDSVF